MKSKSVPQRIQRKRTKGWRMPPNTVSVTRPGKWGNPFVVRRAGQQWIVTDREGRFSITKESRQEAAQSAVSLFRSYLENDGSQAGQIRDDGGSFIAEMAKEELRGKNLACFCSLDKPCHADVLIEYANKGATTK